MNENQSENGQMRDHYRAQLKDGELVMTPYCACGNILKEDYFCEKCNRGCRCYDILCDNEKTLETVKAYIRKSPQFSVYRARLAK